MRLTMTDNTGTKCPACGVYLSVKETWECDGEPYPDQNVKCPNCSKWLHVSQYVTTELEEVN